MNKSIPQPAIPLDDLPRPGVAISRERWIDLIAKEERLLELDRDADADRVEEEACVSLLVAEIAALRDIIKRASVRFFHDGSDGAIAKEMLEILDEVTKNTNEQRNETPDGL